MTAVRRRRAAPKPLPSPSPVPKQCDHPVLLRVYWAADRAEGEERRELLSLAARVKRAAQGEIPPEERWPILDAAERRMGVLL